MRIRPTAVAALLALVALGSSASAAATPENVTWHGSQIHLYEAEAAGHDGAGVTVAVLDSWVDVAHPDFEGRASAVDCLGGTCKAGQVKDSCTHGTHVAGTVASTSFGVARKAHVLAIQVLSADSKKECTGTPSDVAAGIHYAVAHGAQVLNLSLGPDVSLLGGTSAIPAAVHEAAAAGAVVVFSAGNADNQQVTSYGSDALVVAATGPSGHLASYSQHGQGVSVAAPGGEPTNGDTCTQDICITSLYPGGQYAVAAGTSMAAPHVAGLAALLLGQSPHRGRQDVINRITGTAHPLAGAGAGLIDVKAALGVRTTATPPPATHKPVPVIKTHTTAPTVKRTTAPTKAPAKPTPSPTLSPTPAPVVPTETPSAEPTSPPPLAVTLPVNSQDDVPTPLAGLAGVLVGLAGLSVLIAPRLTRR